MDPDKVLEEIRELANDARDPDFAEEGTVETLVEKVTALDEWLSRGGFLPRKWGHP